MSHVFVLRSPVAHAHIKLIDVIDRGSSADVGRAER
jgi:hypothetical protein